MPIYSNLYSNFIRQGSQFAKSITSHGYAQSVVAATHPHVLNTQNRPVFGRRYTNRHGRFVTFQPSSALHTERTASLVDHRLSLNHGSLDAYFAALKKKQASGEVTNEDWEQYEFPKLLEWKPDADDVLTSQEALTLPDEHHDANPQENVIDHHMTHQEAAALAHIDAALEREIEARRSRPEEQLVSLPSPPASPLATLRTPTPLLIDPQSQSYSHHLLKLSTAGRYAEIPAVFEAMLATGVKPIAGAYNALLLAAIHIPVKRIEVVSKALDVYADMLRRRVTPDGQTYDILVNLLASRSIEIANLKSALEEKRIRFGGMEEPGKFMLASHELERAILCEDDRLDLAIKLFDTSVTARSVQFSSNTYSQLIEACALAGRVSDMLRLFSHMEDTQTIPHAQVFPTMITAYATAGDLVSAVECYNEYRSLAVASDVGTRVALNGRVDAQVYAAIINAYVISNKIEGAMKFFKKIVDEYGVKVADMKDALISSGFVKGFITRGILDEALYWAQSIQPQTRPEALARVAIEAADNNDVVTATEAYRGITGPLDLALAPSMAMLAMSVRDGDVASATKYWHVLTNPEMHASSAFIEPTAMYAVALIGSGQVAEGLAQSEIMFQRIRASESEARSQLSEEIEEGVDFIARYMVSRGIVDPREMASQVSTVPQQSMTASPFMSTPTVSSFEDSFDPYAHNTDFKGSSLISDDLEGGHGRKGPRLTDALNRLRNMRRAGRHPRYIIYAKLISTAAREGKMDLCHEITDMARTDVPLLPQYAVVRYGWSSILDAMIGACLTVGNRGRAEQYHQELLEMGSAPSANTFGLYITTLKDSTKTFDEASEAVRIFLRAKNEGVEPSSFLYNALIGKLGKARRIDDCLFYFAEMRALGIKPTSVTYGTIVNALCRVSDEKFAEELFDEMECMPNYKARPAPYNSMMQFFLTTKRDKVKVLAYYERMKAKGITPTSHTYKLLIDSHATLEPINMAAAEDLVEQMTAAGQQPEPVHYASLIHAKGCVLHDLQGARKIFDSVTEKKAVPANASLYQAMFEGMVANHKVAETEPLVAQMRQCRVELTPYIANTLIHGWAAEKDLCKAQAIYEAVPREKREPSTYESMTRAFLAMEQRHQAKAVVGEMLTRGYPSAVVNKVLELLGGGQEQVPA